MEAFNEVGRIESWEQIEALLQKNCIREAVQMAKIEKYLAYNSLKQHMSGDKQATEIVMKRNADVAKKAVTLKSPDYPPIPTCH